MRFIGLRAAVLAGLMVSGGGYAPADAQEIPPGSQPGIWIGGADGRLRQVEPVTDAALRRALAPAPRRSTLRVVLAVDGSAPSAGGALAATELAVARIVAVASSLGIGAAEIRKEESFVQPRYQRRGVLTASWEEPRLLGFDAGQVLVVGLPEAQVMSLFVDLAVGAGATRVLAVERERSARE